MTGPPTVHVPLRVLDVDDAIRIAQALDAALSVLWQVYGEEMGERLLDRYCADADTEVELPDSWELPF